LLTFPAQQLAFQPSNKISFCFFLCSVPTTLQTKIPTTEERVTRSLKKVTRKILVPTLYARFFAETKVTIQNQEVTGNN